MTVLEKLVYTKTRLSEAEKALSTVSVLLKECIIEYQQRAATCGAVDNSVQQANGAMPQPVDIPLRVDPSFSAWDSNGDLW